MKVLNMTHGPKEQDENKKEDENSKDSESQTVESLGFDIEYFD